MATVNLAELILSVRRQTSTTGTSETSGISDNEFVDYFNDAQERLQSRLTSKYSNIFTKEYEFSPVANQEEYSFPSDAYAVNRIWLLEFSSTGNPEDYYNLKRRSFSNRQAVYSNYPTFYILKGNKILVNPIVNTSTGSFRLTYEAQARKLDIARGTILSTDNDGTDYTTITLDPEANIDDDFFASADYISFVGILGEPTEQMGPTVASYDSSSRIVTLNSGFSIADDTLTAGMRIVGGMLSTTHTTLPDICQRYLKSYVAWKIQRRDSNISDASPQERELQALEDDIEEMFAANDRDEIEIPYSEDF